MTYPVKAPKKLIEVALPLDAINAESLRRKQKAPKGFPTSFHKWWAQRPVAAARAILFAQLVNDPGFQQGSGFKYGRNRKDAAAERRRLFQLIEELVLWDGANEPATLAAVGAEIRRSWQETCELNRDHPDAATLFARDTLPAVYDPFAGSGTIPLEAQRLGLPAIASDLNPVAATICKGLMELPRRFAGRQPVCPTAQGELGMSRSWPGARGLAEDVRHYGAWMRKEAEHRIGHLYPDFEVSPGLADGRPEIRPLVGKRLTVVAWIWARTVRSPSPAFRHVHVPLASTFVLSTKGNLAHAEPIVRGDRYSFRVVSGRPPAGASRGTKLGRGAFRCLLSGSPIAGDYIKAEAQAGRMGSRMMAVVADSELGRVYLSPTEDAEAAAHRARPGWIPDGAIVDDPRAFTPTLYGMNNWRDLFTPRQLAGLSVFSDLSCEARARCKADALRAGLLDDGRGLSGGGIGATAYSEAVSVYLALAVDRMIFYGSTLCGWLTKDNAMGKSMPQQALMMTWDFAEGNPLGKSSADISTCVRSIANYLDMAAPNADVVVAQRSAASGSIERSRQVICTDPPYYDNVPYADLSDFFYVWLRRSLRPIYPELFSTLLTPKAEELVASPYRHGGKDGAESFFLAGMTKAMAQLGKEAHPAFPVCIYYAFKQAESDGKGGSVSTGWDTFLAAIIQAGFAITGTWPLRTEGESRMRASESNALASSIVLVCRKRPDNAPSISRRQFIRELNAVLPEALDEMTRGAGEDQSPVAPVDLSQAIIGPGMAVFSKYTAVLEADGTPMTVKTALQLINRFLAEDDFDADTQFCLRWFEQHGWAEGAYGEADVLARAKATSVGGLNEAGVVQSGGGKVRLLRWAEYPADWNPRQDKRLPVWEALHQLIRAFKADGESGSGQILGAVKDKTEPIRQLAYRLYTLCERRGWAEDARAYNELVTSWSAIEAVASAVPEPKKAEQLDLDLGGRR